MSLIFKKCDICGNEVLVFHDSGNNIICCGKPMKVVEPKSLQFKDKDSHAPYVYQADNKVLITFKHDKSIDHHLEWVIIETNKGFHKKDIEETETPTVLFTLDKDEYVLYVYLYCNTHGLFRD